MPPSRCSPGRRRAFALAALAALVGLGACGGDGTSPEVGSGMALQVRADPELVAAIEHGTIHLEGPTPRTVDIQPGETRTIEGLAPGTYTVVLEAFSQGRLAGYGETRVKVEAGSYPDADITLNEFVPTGPSLPDEVVVGEAAAVTFGAVAGATTYEIAWSADPDAASPSTMETEETTAELTFDVPGTYQVRVSARDRFGSIGFATEAVPIEVVPRVIQLENGIALPGRSGEAGSASFFSFEVPEGSNQRVLQVRLRGGTGNADLALRLEADPTPVAFDCASDASASAYANGLDFCSVINPEAGTWHILLQGTEAYVGVAIDARLLPLRTLDGPPVTGLSGGAGDIAYYRFDVPAGGGAGGPARAPAALHLATTGGTGNVDLLATPGADAFGLSGLGGWACVGSRDGNEERCDVDDPTSGPWTVVLVGQEAFAGVTLSSSYAMPSHRLSVSAGGSGRITGGGIDCTFTSGSPSGSCAVDVPADTDVTLTAQAAEGMEFAGWSGSCTGGGSCVVTMSHDRDVHAAFQPPSRYTLSVSVIGSGRVSGGGIDCIAILGANLGTCTLDLPRGAKVKLTAAPAFGFSFSGWSGACSGKGACALDMTEARSVQASFSRPFGG